MRGDGVRRGLGDERRRIVGSVFLFLALVAGVVVRVAAPAESAVTTATLLPVGDAYVDGSTPTTNYGTNPRLVVDASPARETYLRFDLSSFTGPVENARLRLHVANITDSQSPNAGTVARLSDGGWTESGVTYANRPTGWEPNAGALGSVNRNTWVEIPVTTAVVTGVHVTLGIRSPEWDGAYFDSRHTGANSPQLVVTAEPASASTTSSPSTTSSSTTSSTTTSSTTTTTTTMPGATTTIELTPVADAYVDSATPGANYGAQTRLISDASPIRETLLRFDLTSVSGPILQARLRIHVANVTDSQTPNAGTLARVNQAWTEAGVNFGNRPTNWSAPVANVGAVTRNTWVERDITSTVSAGGPLDLGLRTPSADGGYFDSRESGANGPKLLVTVPGTPPPPPTGTRIAAVGDMVCAPGAPQTANTCRHMPVSDLLVADPTIAHFFPLGDLQYEDGTLAEFQAAYDPSYGRVKGKTRPIIGNHEYNTTGASGYFTYFGAAAGTPGAGYYSFDIGTDWHVVALNSNCTKVACTPGSAQETWLRADLAANSRPCTLAMWHHPRFSSGTGHGSDPAVAPFWDALQAFGAEVVLGGHDHIYERYAPQLPSGVADGNGIQEFVVGTGGRSLYGFTTPVANSVARLSAFGVMKMTLGDDAYAWQFVDEQGQVLDSGTRTCH